MMSIRYTSEQLQEKFGHGNSGFAFARMADSLREEGRMEEAIALCTHKIQQHPDYLTGRLVGARCLLEADRLRPAREEFEAALRLDPRCLAAWKGLAQTLARMSDKGSEACLARIQEIDPWFDTSSLVGGSWAPAESTFEESLSGDRNKTLELSLDDVGDYLPSSDEESFTLEAEPNPDETVIAAGIGFETETEIVDSEERIAIEDGDGDVPVSGQDVENRLDSIFGEESSDSSGDASGNTGFFAEAADVGGDSPDLTATAFQPFPEIGGSSVADAGETESELDSELLTGEDVADHLDRFFEEEPEPLPLTQEKHQAEEPLPQEQPEAAVPVDEFVAETETIETVSQPQEEDVDTTRHDNKIVSGFEFLGEDAGGPAEIEKEEGFSFSAAGDSNALARDSMQDWLMGTEEPEATGIEANNIPEVSLESSTPSEISTSDTFASLFADESIAEESSPPRDEAETAHDSPSGSDTVAFEIGAPEEGDPSVEELTEELENRLDQLFDDDGEGSGENPPESVAAEEDSSRPMAEFPFSAGTETLIMPRSEMEKHAVEEEDTEEEVQETVDLRRDPFTDSATATESSPMAGLFEEPLESEDGDAGSHNLFEIESPQGRNSGVDPEIVSGQDVTQRLNELFGSDHPDDGPLDDDASLTGADQTTIAPKVEPSLAKEFGFETETDFPSEEETPLQSEKAGEKEPVLFEAEEEKSASDTHFIETDKHSPVVSGDDISSRLAMMFGDSEVGSESETVNLLPVPETTQESGLDAVLPHQEERADNHPIGQDSGEDEAPLEDEESEEIPTNVATVTLAEIYFQQGLKEQALQIYRQLLDREPENEAAQKRIAEIEASKTEEDNSEDDATDRPGRQRGVRPGTRPGYRSGRPPRRRG